MDKRNSRTAGYRLHRNRILFSGGQITRSIKFPLKPLPESENLKEKFEQEIITDDLKIRGGVNLPDYQQNPNRYTLADFWIDSLRAGVIWQPTTSRLDNFVKKFFKEPSLGEKIFAAGAKVNSKLRFFDKEKFTGSIILAKPKRKSGSAAGFRRELFRAVQPAYNENQELRQLLDKIVNDFYDEAGKLKLNGEAAQNGYWLKEFSIDKSALRENAASAGPLSKLTFFILPSLINLNEKITVTGLVEKRKQLFSEEDIADVLGVENNFNALSHYLNYAFQSLYSGKTDEIFQTFTGKVSAIKRYEKEVKEALEFLADKAKKVGYPQVDRAWHEYRSVFGGKIKSWFSNYQRRDKELQEQTQKLQRGIKNARDLINKSAQSDASLKPEAQNIIDLLTRINQLIEQNIDNLRDSSKYDVFLDLLTQARRELNFFYQKYIKGEDDDTSVNQHKELKDLYVPVYRPMIFFAKGRLEQNEKNLNKTVDIIQDGLRIAYQFLESNRAGFDPENSFEDVKRKNETPEALYRRALQRIWAKLKDKRINSTKFREKYTQILKRALENKGQWNKIFSKQNKYCFYQSPYVKGTITQVALKPADFLSSFKAVAKDLDGFAVSLKEVSIFGDKGLLQDKNELLKSLVADFIRFNTKEEFSVAGLDFTQFEKARKYLELSRKDKLNKNEAAFLCQSLIFSELRGAITVFTKEKYTSRYVLQVMKTPDKFPLFYFSKTKALDDANLKLNQKGASGNDLLSQKPHYYCVAINQGMKTSKETKSSPFLRLDKKKVEIVGLEEADRKNLLKISTSPYQQQFLERFVSPVGDWRKADIALSEWSFIVEKDYRIDWNRKQNQPIFTQTGETKLFVSIPFQISAKVAKEKADLTKLSKNRLNYPILGIDVGEYGVGWVLVKFAIDAVTVLRKGFIRDRNIAAIQKNFAAIQRRAKSGMFNTASTAVAEVRENAIGAIRNQIHDILTKEITSVAYEYQISNFETGSGRVTKIYNSVKRSDVYPETNADKQQHTHVWGGKYINPGTHLSAYASSYSCVACARSVYEFSQEDVGQANIIAREGNILTIKTPRGNVIGYTQNKYPKGGYTFKGTKEEHKEFMKLVKDFARPPVISKNDQPSETISKFAPHLSKTRLRQVAQQRGNSAIFICPFAGCHNAADADIQAALMMAVRGYLNWSGRVKATEKEKKDYLGKTLGLLSSLKDRSQLSKDFTISAGA